MAPHTPLEAVTAARCNEARQMHALRDLAAESIDLAGGVVTFSPGVDWINHATMLGFAVDVDEHDLDTFEAFLTERGAPPKLEMTTFATEGFLASLAARNYAVEQFENVLNRPLRAGEDPFAQITHALPRGLEIVRTDPADADACREHAILVCSGFMPEPIPEAHIDISIRAIVHPRSAGFLARIDGIPVGGCGMEIFEHEGRRAAALWGAAVVEPFRRRGIQQAMLAHRMAHALAHGCEFASIESKPGIATERNAARMGFSLGYVRVCMTKTVARERDTPVAAQ